jgi:ATP-dependent Clp protease ATP-binding subunit ClpA
LEIELENVQTRIASVPSGRFFELRYTQAAKEFLLREGADSQYGARHLKRAIERLVVFPLSSLMATGQIEDGDTVQADLLSDGTGLTFTAEHRPPVLVTGGTPEGPARMYRAA